MDQCVFGRKAGALNVGFAEILSLLWLLRIFSVLVFIGVLLKQPL